MRARVRKMVNIIKVEETKKGKEGIGGSETERDADKSTNTGEY